MRLNVVALLASAGLVSLKGVQVCASPVESMLVTAGPMTYIGPIVPGGTNVTLQGTVQEIYSQIEQLTGSRYLPRAFGDNEPGQTIRPRSKTSINCHPVGEPAYPRAIQDGIKYLSGLQGDCKMPGRNCGRISCSYRSGIFLCNDSIYGISVPCRHLATYAQDILDYCHREHVSTVRGQEFDSEGYNVIVKKGNC